MFGGYSADTTTFSMGLSLGSVSSRVEFMYGVEWGETGQILHTVQKEGNYRYLSTYTVHSGGIFSKVAEGFS